MGFRLSKIYTRTGDQGETGLGDGRRVPKDHPRIEAIGEVDTLNSQLGLLLAGLAEHSRAAGDLDEVLEVLSPCQHRLFDLGGELAMPSYQALDGADMVYFSGISIAILAPRARGRLLKAIVKARDKGARVVFDTNLRPALWTSPEVMKSCLTCWWCLVWPPFSGTSLGLRSMPTS